jgi:hypothetical protein
VSTDGRQQQVQQTLANLHDLTSQDRADIASLALNVNDSIVVAHLRRAYHLLVRDPSFDWKTRENTWHAWQAVMIDALEESLRLRKNEPLVVALGVCAQLFPLADLGAGLMAYKTINDVVTIAQRGGINPKRERAYQPLHLKDRITRVPLWFTPDGDLSETESDQNIEASGCALDYLNPEPVLQIVGCVLTITAIRKGNLTYIALRP